MGSPDCKDIKIAVKEVQPQTVVFCDLVEVGIALVKKKTAAKSSFFGNCHSFILLSVSMWRFKNV